MGGVLTATGGLVAEAMLTCPETHDPWTTVQELRAFFRDDHVHMALIVDGPELIGVIERADLVPQLSANTPGIAVATLDGRTITAEAALPGVLVSMRREGRRRLAVSSADRRLLGLLCLKANGLGFCSDADVRGRRTATQYLERFGLD
jgi:CBS domain-containing protein